MVLLALTVTKAAVDVAPDTAQAIIDNYGPTFFVVLALAITYLRSKNTGGKVASETVFASFVESTEGVFDMARRAFEMASSAQRELAEVRMSAARCERMNAGLMRHNMMLSNQVISAGLVPVPMPPDSLSWEDQNG